MCETRDLSIKWSYWQTLMFEGQVAVIGMPAGREEDAFKRSQDGLLEEMGSKARAWRAERSMAGTNPNSAAKKDQ